MANAPTLIGVSGLAGSGKDTLCGMLVELGYTQVAFADPLKRIVQGLYGFSEETLWGASELRNTTLPEYLDPTGNPMSARHCLQLIGTEGVRASCPDTWVILGLKSSKAILEGARYTRTKGVFDVGVAPAPRGVCLSDVRFKNEVEAIRAAGGKLIRIVRPQCKAAPDNWLRRAIQRLTQIVRPAHRSERELSDMPDSCFDFVIHNEGTLEDLRQIVVSIEKKLCTI